MTDPICVTVPIPLDLVCGAVVTHPGYTILIGKGCLDVEIPVDAETFDRVRAALESRRYR